MNHIPTTSYIAVADRDISGIAPTTIVLQTTRVEPTHNVVDLIYADDDDNEYLISEVVHKVEDVPENENNYSEDEEYQAEEPNK